MAKTVKIPAVHITPITVSDAKTPFFKWLDSRSTAQSTKNAYGTIYNRLIEAAGPRTYLHNVQPAHITDMMLRIKDRGQGTKNNYISYLRTIWQWASMCKHVTPFAADWPLEAAGSRKSYEVGRHPYIPAKEWPALLDTADQFGPIYRVYAALGLYLLARGPSEIGTLRLWDLDCHNWQVSVVRDKTKMTADAISICGELRLELVRWLRFYNEWTTTNLGVPLQKEWYLLPRQKYSRRGIEHYKLVPDKHRAANTIVQTATKILEAYGSPARGSHAFRRMGGRALYNELRESGEGRDKALDIVRSMYGHKSREMTEHYLDLRLDRETRNQAIVSNDGFMYGHNNPNQKAKPVDLSTRQLPASLTGAVLLGGASQTRLDEVDRQVETLPEFLRAVA